MKASHIALLAALTVLFAPSSDAICGKQHGHVTRPTADLPPHAAPGECYARVATPAEYRDVVETVTRREEGEKIRIIPATYETRSERVLVKPATTRMVEVPAEYAMVDREIEVEPARQEWRPGKCNPRAVVDNATGECWCLVDVPPRMKTVRERVVSVPASTRAIDVPAEYEMVSKRVLVEPEREERIRIPAIVENVTRRELVADARTEWVRIACEPKDEAAEWTSGNDLWSFPHLRNSFH